MRGREDAESGGRDCGGAEQEVCRGGLGTCGKKADGNELKWGGVLGVGGRVLGGRWFGDRDPSFWDWTYFALWSDSEEAALPLIQL